MPSSLVFSGTGDPNGVVDGAPGDVYQDQTGKLWVNTAAPSTWVALLSSAGPTPGFVLDGSASGGVLQNNGTGNTAPGANAIAGGNGSSATAATAIALGDGCTASGVSSTSLGSSGVDADFGSALGSSNVHAPFGVAGGNSNVNAASDFGTALGNSNVQANSSYATASGNSNATGQYSTAIGNASANGEAAVALGFGDATGEGATAMGIASASGAYATAMGLSSALADYATSLGVRSSATRQAQLSHASGNFAASGDAQSSQLEMRGATPGAAPGESVELVFGDAVPSQLVLEDGKAYAVTYTAVAAGTQAGPTRVSRSFEGGFNVRRDAGVSTITAAAVGQSYGDASTNDWTLVASVGVAPDRLVLTFSTGAVATAARAVAKVEFTEVAY